MIQNYVRSFLNTKQSWQIEILGLTACVLTVFFVSLRPVAIEFLYVALLSVFLCVIFVTGFRKKIGLEKGRFFIMVFLCLYILLTIWLGFIKVIPEYRMITNFESKRSDLIYTIFTLDAEKNKSLKFKSELNLARLYLHALEPIERIESTVKHKGAKMMARLLLEKINENKGAEYYDEMFELADSAYEYSGKAFSKTWYKRAFDAGRLDALKRYNQRIMECCRGLELVSRIMPFEE